MKLTIVLTAVVAAATLMATTADARSSAELKQQAASLRLTIGTARKLIALEQHHIVAGQAWVTVSPGVAFLVRPIDRVKARTHISVLRGVLARALRKRALVAKQLAALSPPRPAHYSLWSCITNGAYPGAAHEGNGYNGPYSGPLGMTTPWAGHWPPGSDWVHSDVVAVYRLAETEYADHGYSSAWLRGQWPNTSPPCSRFAG